MFSTPKLPFLRFATLLSLLAPLPLFGACSAGEPTTGLGGLPPGAGGASGGSQSGTGGASAGTSAGGSDTGTGGSRGSAGNKSVFIDPGMLSGSGGMTANCGAENHQAMIKPLAIYLLVDWSASMTEMDDRWAPVSTALQTFVNDPESAGIQVGLGDLPVENADTVVKCDAAEYTTASVQVGMLPETAAAITTSLTSKTYVLGEIPDVRLSTPTAPAMTGSIEYFSGWLAAHPDHIGVVVLATDGEPALCSAGMMGFPMGGTGRGTPEELQATVDAIAAAAAGTPAINTYVIGIGNLMAALDQMATAGGTNHAPFIVDGTGTNTQTEFLEAMKEIRGAALPCSFQVPIPTMGSLEYSKVNVDYQPAEGATAVPFFKVENEAACAGSTNGWYYDDPLHPTSVELCPAACESVRSVETSSVGISLGCETRVN